jgi:hypothetical protein
VTGREPHTWSFRVRDVAVRVAAPEAEILRLVRDQMPAFEAPRAAGAIDRRYLVEAADGGYRIRVDGRRPGVVRGSYGAANRVVADLQGFLARRLTGMVLVHAGVVRWRGRAIVIPGRAFSGKSTLVSAFAAAGAAYGSDEFAVLDGRGKVHPFARPLALRVGGGALQRTPPACLAGGEMRRSTAVGLVLVCRYRAGAHWSPRTLSPAETVFALMRHSLAVRYRPGETLAVLRAVAERAVAFTGLRGEASEVVEAALAGAAEQPRTRASGG